MRIDFASAYCTDRQPQCAIVTFWRGRERGCLLELHKTGMDICSALHYRYQLARSHTRPIGYGIRMI